MSVVIGRLRRVQGSLVVEEIVTLSADELRVIKNGLLWGEDQSAYVDGLDYDRVREKLQPFFPSERTGRPKAAKPGDHA